jgi:hypothetical protein
MEKGMRVLYIEGVAIQGGPEPRAKTLYANARAHGHTKNETRRILKRHLSDVVYRRMIRDLADHAARPLFGCLTAPARRAAPHNGTNTVKPHHDRTAIG